jgi:multicomponent Na+:H+ antiporter subunit D
VLLWKFPTGQRVVGLVGSLALLGSAMVLLSTVSREGVQVMQASGWPAPIGISLVADLFSSIMVLMAGIMGVAVMIYSMIGFITESLHEDVRHSFFPLINAGRDGHEGFGYYPLIHFLLVGVCGAFLTGDIFNLYVWYEVMLISSFVLLVLGGERAQLEGGIKYVTLNLMASALFLAGVGILYGTVGTLNMADLGQRMPGIAGSGLSSTLAILFLVAFGIKSALFPLFFWVPAAYHTPPLPVTVIFSGLLTKVGIYSLVRIFTLIFRQDIAFTHTVLLVIAGLTMVTGVLGAVAQYDMRRLLSFHIISQIGYLLMGLGLFSPLALAGTIFFMVHVILAKSALFLVGGVLYYLTGTYDLKKLGGFYRASPLLALLFALPAFSLAGIPPLSGFWAKFALVRAGLEQQQYLVVAAALAVGLLTLFSMTKIWNEAFLKEQPDTTAIESARPLKTMALEQQVPLVLPIAVMAVLMVVIGVGAEPLFALSMRAAGQLMDPTEYMQAVLGG